MVRGRRQRRLAWIAAVPCLCLAAPAAAGSAAAPAAALGRFTGASDASAAAALDTNTLAVADDENNTLRLYRLNSPGAPAAEVDLAPFLAGAGRAPGGEADLEGCARVGDRIYWTASHARNRDGKEREERCRFFATAIRDAGNGRFTLEPVGAVYRRLRDDLLKYDAARGLGLAAAIGPGLRQAAPLAPEAGGLNIEGLAAAPDGRSLLLGFRSPLPRGKALLVPLLNPAAMVDGGQAAELGPPILLDLGGRGIRSIDYSPAHGRYLLAAGPVADDRGFRIFRWSGAPDGAPAALPPGALPAAADFKPEALVVCPGGKRVALLSDDGDLQVDEQGFPVATGGRRNKDLADPARKSFRWMRLTVE